MHVMVNCYVHAEQRSYAQGLRRTERCAPPFQAGYGTAREADLQLSKDLKCTAHK